GPISGAWTYYQSITAPTAGDATRCASSGLVPSNNGVVPAAAGGAMAAGSVIEIPLSIGAPAVGSPVFLYQEITYQFKPSVMVPGSRLALWRRVEETGFEEELVAPFAPTARFRFYVNDAATAQSAVPADLSTVTGIEIVLDAISERPNPDGSHQEVPLTTSVFFKNR